jgi:hypothetical protein
MHKHVKEMYLWRFIYLPCCDLKKKYSYSVVSACADYAISTLHRVTVYVIITTERQEVQLFF